MSEPTSPDDRAVGAAERLHPLFLLSGLGGSLRSLAGAYALVAYLVVSGRLATALVGAVALLVFMMVGVFLYWTRFEFRVGMSEIQIDSGIVSRRHRTIPFDRIQDVDITQGPVARLLGLATVKFETGAGAAGPNAEDAVIQAVTFERAQELRAFVRAHRTREAPLEPMAAAGEADRPPVYAMSTGRLLLAGAFNFSLAVFAGLFGLSQTVGDLVGFDPLNRRFWTGVARGSEPITQFVLQHRAGAAIAGSLLLLIIGAATGIVRTVLRDWGFRLDRTEIGLRRRRGLLTRTDVTLPVKRAQAAIMGSGPVRSLFGWRELELQSLAQDEGGRGNHVLAPLATAQEADAILLELGWRPLPERVEWTRVSSAYIWIRVVALGPLFAILVLQGAAALLLAPELWDASASGTAAAGVPLVATTVVLLAVLAAAAFSRWFAWWRTCYALDGDRLLIRTGWWRRRLVILPAAKIQSMDLTESFISRRFGVANLRFGVAGGGMQGHSIPAIPSSIARQLRKELLVSTA